MTAAFNIRDTFTDTQTLLASYTHGGNVTVGKFPDCDNSK